MQKLAILGRKIGMTQIFKEEGDRVPVTVVQAGPCPILQVKSQESHGYSALQIAFEDKKAARCTKAALGHFKKAGVSPKRFVREIRVKDVPEQYQVGGSVTVDVFQEGDWVDVTGTTIGKGFAGGMKRWNWRGGPGGHGSMSHRAPGSIGQSSSPSRVFRGLHMPGHMGNVTQTVQNLRVVSVDYDRNLLLIRGAVPGSEEGCLVIRHAVKKKMSPRIERVKPEPEVQEEAPVEEEVVNEASQAVQEAAVEAVADLEAQAEGLVDGAPEKNQETAEEAPEPEGEEKKES
ncbi:MAG: 50S ribosomal protein L3 [Candidatus Omnitrophica bacterium]|nr:50S ribosomal protein L3 [Candidatus Omnitrophota bacterium]